MPTAAELLTTLDNCPRGETGWRQFEDLGIDILKFLFVPPLTEPLIQPRSYSGIDRRDALLPNRNMNATSIWGQLRQELAARMVLVEFKNYDRGDVEKEEVDQTRNYLTTTIGKFGIVISRKPPAQQALLRRNQVYTQEQKVIVFLTDENLKEMIRIKDRGDDPAAFIMDLVELFYAQYE